VPRFQGRSQPAPEPDRAESAGAGGPTIAAHLNDGPLEGRTVRAETVEGRPPKTIDVEDAGGACRYCLADWAQTGGSAAYTFLYRV